MTPLHKLSIIIGFSVVLVVAIIVTDHLSPATNNTIAQLEQNQTTNSEDIRNRQLPNGIGSNTSNPSTGNASNGIKWDRAAGNYSDNNRNNNTLSTNQNDQKPESIYAIGEASQAISVQTTELGEGKTDERIQKNNENILSSPNQKIHIVKPNDTLYSIAKLYYGNGSLADELAVYNTDRIPDNLIIIPDLRLLIPDRNVLLGDNNNSNNINNSESANPPVTNNTAYKEYKIKPGDTMTEISMHELGTFRRWHEIYELNKDVIDDPDRLKAGVTIKIPTGR